MSYVEITMFVKETFPVITAVNMGIYGQLTMTAVSVWEAAISFPHYIVTLSSSINIWYTKYKKT